MQIEAVLVVVAQIDKATRKELINKRFREKGLILCEEVTEDAIFREKLICQDSVGYKYKTSYEGLRGKLNPLPFIQSNSFTIDNIRLFLKNNKEGFILISNTYTHSRDYNLEVRCPNGHIFTSSWAVLQREETGCIKCSSPNRGLTKEEFEDILGSEYKLLGDYINTSTDVILRHECGYEYPIQPSRFIINSPKCKKCLGLTTKTPEEFIREVFELYGDEYKILSSYNHSHEKILVRHNCNYEYPVTPTNLLSGKKCPRCAGQITMSHSEFVENVQKESNGEYLVLGEYVDSKEKILLKHIECGYEWKVRPSHFLKSGSRCPDCQKTLTQAEQKLGRFIKDSLVGTRYRLLQQHWFDDCRGSSNSPYYFDYTIINEYDEVVLIIERHGNQHYEYVPFLHRTIENFLHQQLRDREKAEYCISKNISLEVIEARRTNYERECNKVIELLSHYKLSVN